MSPIVQRGVIFPIGDLVVDSLLNEALSRVGRNNPRCFFKAWEEFVYQLGHPFFLPEFKGIFNNSDQHVDSPYFRSHSALHEVLGKKTLVRFVFRAEFEPT